MPKDQSMPIFEFNKKYFFDHNGVTLEDDHRFQHGHLIDVNFCCRLQIPRGFKPAREFPRVCFDFDDLACIKKPLIKTISVTDCHKPLECEVVAGYEVSLVGCLNFAVSTPITPGKGGVCPLGLVHTCCSGTVPVHHHVTSVCEPAPCPKGHICVDAAGWCLLARLLRDSCGEYIELSGSLFLKYNGACC